MDCPKVKIFVNNGRVEAVYADTYLLDVEVIECTRAAYLRGLDYEYDKAEAAGLHDINEQSRMVTATYYGEDDESA